jgi:hypothetical protein
VTLVTAGTTTHYKIQYDDSLSAADGQQRAAGLLAVAERDYALMSGWFGGINLTVRTPVEVNISPGPYASAGWGPPIRLTPGGGSGLDVVRYLLVAEVTEMFMLAQNKGWFASDGSNEGSAGEGLSRVLSAEFLRKSDLGSNEPGFDTAGSWLNSDRLDFVNNVDEHDHAPDAKSGCATLFINYLSYQLGYDIYRVIAAAAPTLAGVHRHLTGSPSDPFPAFKAMLDAHLPRHDPEGNPINVVVPGPDPDNPYPLDRRFPEVLPVAIRIFWRMNPGRNVVNLNWPAVSADSVVAVTASEYNAASQELPDGSDQRFVGAAPVTVANVTPHGPPFDPNLGVTFAVDVGWNAPLNICTDVALLANSPQQVIYIGPRSSSGTQATIAGAQAAGSAMATDGPVTYHAATIAGDQVESAVHPPAPVGDRPGAVATSERGIVETTLEARVQS